LKRSGRRWISSPFGRNLNAALSYTDRTEGARSPFDPVLMLKTFVVQATNHLSDERAEFLINGRLSLVRFLGPATARNQARNVTERRIETVSYIEVAQSKASFFGRQHPVDHLFGRPQLRNPGAHRPRNSRVGVRV
jgi:hypothetical protein